MGYNPISDRLIKIQGKPHNISIIQCYAPTSTASDEEMEEFYCSLQEALDSIPKQRREVSDGWFQCQSGEIGI